MSAVGEVWSFLTTASNWSGSSGLWTRTVAHVWISAVATVLAATIALPPAIWLGHRRMVPVLSVGVANLGRAIPSFAVIALVLPISISLGFGLGFWPTCVALVALGIPPMFTNTYTGIVGTAPETTEAARAIGMTDPQVLRRVELPSALPFIITGVRISAVQIIATATLGALVGYQCLGSYVIEGLAQPSRARDRLLTGAVLVATLAMSVDHLINRVETHLIRWRRPIR
jgi:osmoprotectant transport system permease protein